MQVRCVRAFGTSVPGDLAEVPDGAAVDPEHWEPATPPPPPADPPPPDVPPPAALSFPAAAKPEGM